MLGFGDCGRRGEEGGIYTIYAMSDATLQVERIFIFQVSLSIFMNKFRKTLFDNKKSKFTGRKNKNLRKHLPPHNKRKKGFFAGDF